MTSGSSSGAGAARAPEGAFPMPSPATDGATRATSKALSLNLGPSAVPGIGAQVIKDARISLQVKRHASRTP